MKIDIVFFKDFSDKLCDIKIDCPEDYIASNFFGSSQKQYAVFLKYEFPFVDNKLICKNV